MIDTQKLRQRILDLAIRGKLVPQDPNDEPASVLLEKIRAEKERLIAAGKIKRPKAKKSSDKSHCDPFEPPFDIPASWVWVRLEEVCELLSGRDLENNQCNSNIEGIPYLIGASNIIDGKFKFIRWTTNPQVVSSIGDILISCKGTIGEILINDFGNIHIARQFMAIRSHSHLVDSSFLLIVLEWSLEFIKEQANGIIPGISRPVLLELNLPIPPIAEQKKIIAEVQKYVTILKTLTNSVSNLRISINYLKSKILDLAMQGKLVEQDPTDEPAAEMLRRINPKAKIITDNPHSWNIPSNWCWVEVKSVFQPMQRRIPEGDSFHYIDIDSVDNKTNTLDPKYIRVKDAPSRAARKTHKDDVVFSMVRPYLRNIAKVTSDDCIASTGFYVFTPTEAIEPDFAFMVVMSNFFVNGINSFMKGDNSPSVNKDNIDTFVIPLPPLKEQKRVVAKIEELYSVLNEIEASLNVCHN